MVRVRTDIPTPFPVPNVANAIDQRRGIPFIGGETSQNVLGQALAPIGSAFGEGLGRKLGNALTRSGRAEALEPFRQPFIDAVARAQQTGKPVNPFLLGLASVAEKSAEDFARALERPELLNAVQTVSGLLPDVDRKKETIVRSSFREESTGERVVIVDDPEAPDGFRVVRTGIVESVPGQVIPSKEGAPAVLVPRTGPGRGIATPIRLGSLPSPAVSPRNPAVSASPDAAQPPSPLTEISAEVNKRIQRGEDPEVVEREALARAERNALLSLAQSRTRAPGVAPTTEEKEIIKQQARIAAAGPIAEAKQQALDSAELFKTITERGDAARIRSRRLQQISEVAKNIPLGQFGEFKLLLAKIAQEIPVLRKFVPKNVVAGAELIQSFNAEEAINFLQDLDGAKSDFETRLGLAVTPGLAKTQGGFQVLIRALLRQAERDAEIADLAREFKRRFGQLDSRFVEARARLIREKPLYMPEDIEFLRQLGVEAANLPELERDMTAVDQAQFRPPPAEAQVPPAGGTQTPPAEGAADPVIDALQQQFPGAKIRQVR